jgi:hypothetical protein
MANDQKKIACIGWGSLVWAPRDLPLVDEWRNDGPSLPVEFARESGDAPGTRRITLVICPEAPRVTTYWATLDASTINVARDQLGVREYKDATAKWIAKNVGFWDERTDTSFGLEEKIIATWAMANGLAGAVWTNLPCGFRESRETMPQSEAVVAYLRALGPEDRLGAEEYVRNAPGQIDTPYRRAIEDALGWTSRISARREGGT